MRFTSFFVASCARRWRGLEEAPHRLASSSLNDFDLGGFVEEPAEGAAPRRYDHDYAKRAGVTFDGDEARVNELLALRVEAKRRRDFVMADALRDELRGDHGVEVWDRDREWAVAGGGGGGGGGARGCRPLTKRGPPSSRGEAKVCDFHDYARDADDASVVDVAAVDAMLTERLNAKFAADYARADEIRDDLQALGVRVHDGSKAWRGGVDESASDPWIRTDQHYALVGDLDPSADERAIQKLVAERTVARRRRYWDKADEILDALLYDYGVEVDDDSRTWRAIATSYSYDGTVDGDIDVAAVKRLISIRSCCKLRRRFDEADRLRDELKTVHGVILDDKKRKWRVVDN